MGIRIVKEKKARDYTFIDTGLDMERLSGSKEQGPKKSKTERDLRLMDDPKINKLKHKSKLTGGHSMQGHSPVYE